MSIDKFTEKFTFSKNLTPKRAHYLEKKDNGTNYIKWREHWSGILKHKRNALNFISVLTIFMVSSANKLLNFNSLNVIVYEYWLMSTYIHGECLTHTNILSAVTMQKIEDLFHLSFLKQVYKQIFWKQQYLNFNFIYNSHLEVIKQSN